MKVCRQCTKYHDTPKIFWIDEKENKPCERFICDDCKKKEVTFDE